MNSLSMFAFGFLGLTAIIGLRAAHHLVRWGCAGPAGVGFLNGIKICCLLVGLVWLAPHIEVMTGGTIASVQRIAQPLVSHADAFYRPNLAQYAPAVMHMGGRALVR